MISRKWIVAAACLLFLVVAGVSLLSPASGKSVSPAITVQPIASIIPVVPVYNLQGRPETVNVSVTPLIFFAPWCPHCQADVPRIQKELAAMQAHRHIFLVATFLHTSDHLQAIKEVQDFITKYHITMPVVIQANQGIHYVSSVPTLVWMNRTLHEAIPTQANLQLAIR